MKVEKSTLTMENAIYLTIGRDFNVCFMRNSNFCEIFLNFNHFSCQIGTMWTFSILPTGFAEIIYFKMQTHFIFEALYGLKKIFKQMLRKLFSKNVFGYFWKCHTIFEIDYLKNCCTAFLNKSCDLKFYFYFVMQNKKK